MFKTAGVHAFGTFVSDFEFVCYLMLGAWNSPTIVRRDRLVGMGRRRRWRRRLRKRRERIVGGRRQSWRVLWGRFLAGGGVRRHGRFVSGWAELNLGRARCLVIRRLNRLNFGQRAGH